MRPSAAQRLGPIEHHAGKGAQSEAFSGAARVLAADKSDSAELVVRGALRNDVAAGNAEPSGGLEHFQRWMAWRQLRPQLAHVDGRAATCSPNGDRVDAQEFVAHVKVKPRRIPVGEMQGLQLARISQEAARHVGIAEWRDEVHDRRAQLLHAGENRIWRQTRSPAPAMSLPRLGNARPCSTLDVGAPTSGLLIKLPNRADELKPLRAARAPDNGNDFEHNRI